MNSYSVYRCRTPTQSPREQEATALRLASRLLNEAGNQLERNRALNINHGIWSILFRELNSSACLLSETLKKDCLYLAVWSLDYSTRAVLSNLPLSPLAEINITIAEGLEAPKQAEVIFMTAATSVSGTIVTAAWA
jgi:flagellar biosynthesis regulator FlaF